MQLFVYGLPGILLRNCLIIPDKLLSGLPRVVRTEPEAPFCRLEYHQICTLERLLAIYQTVSLGTWVNNASSGARGLPVWHHTFRT
jgi:hypothetical protein